MSRIEQLIGEIEEYIDSCKYQPLSNTKILVNKEEMEELLVELRLRVPDEIKKYQKIISQQEAIIADAKNQADSMITDAKLQTEEMVSDNEIMQQAQAQAESIVNSAMTDADNIRSNAIQYTDEMLASLETIIGRSIDDAQTRYDGLLSSLKSSQEIVLSNRAELSQAFMPQQQAQPGQGADASEGGPLQIPQ